MQSRLVRNRQVREIGNSRDQRNHRHRSEEERAPVRRSRARHVVDTEALANSGAGRIQDYFATVPV